MKKIFNIQHKFISKKTKYVFLKIVIIVAICSFLECTYPADGYFGEPWCDVDIQASAYYKNVGSIFDYFTVTGTGKRYLWKTSKNSKNIFASDVYKKVINYMKKELENKNSDFKIDSTFDPDRENYINIVSINPIIVVAEKNLIQTYWHNRRLNVFNDSITEKEFIQRKWRISSGINIWDGGKEFMWFSPDLKIPFSDIEFKGENKGLIKFNNECIVINKIVRQYGNPVITSINWQTKRKLSDQTLDKAM